MSLIVCKFGGTSVASPERIQMVAKKLIAKKQAGHQVVAVVSAMGKTTDELVGLAASLNDNPPAREMDRLLSTGEQVSMTLLAMAIEARGYKAMSFTGRQAGIETDGTHAKAKIVKVHNERIMEALNRGVIAVVAGFQGIDANGDITTLGRGGSDTTAVALAVALKANLCQIYTDVDGVYTADPRKVAGARKLDEVTYNEMLELATLGAQVLHNRSVELARKYNVKMEVLSSFTGHPGTKVKGVAKRMERSYISSVAKDTNIARIALLGVPNEIGTSFKVFSLLAQHKDIARIALIGVPNEIGTSFKVFSLLARNHVNVDIILQGIGHEEGKDICFTVAEKDLNKTAELLTEHKEELRYSRMETNCDVAKVSVVGAGMINNPGVAAKLFEALYDAGININMISTSEIKISVLVDRRDADQAVQAIHDRFFTV